MTAPAPSGVVTFLFTDIEGSTRRLNYSDDRIARDALSSVRSGVLDLTGVRKTLSPSDAQTAQRNPVTSALRRRNSWITPEFSASANLAGPGHRSRSMHLNRLCGYLKSLRRIRLPNVTI